MPKRPSLREALSVESRIDSTADVFETGGAVGDTDVDAKRKGILVRVSPDVRRDLRIAAIRRGTTVQGLLLAAIAQLLKEPDSAPPKG
jgi:hypothetical protein